LFCDSKQDQAVPLSWFEKAVELFDEYRLSPILFTAGGGEFELDDCHVLADPGGDLVKWGESITARGRDLVDALQKRVVDSLGLDSPRARADRRSDWRANADASSLRGTIYVGIDEELVSDPVALLRWAYDIAKGLFGVRYGIAYKMPLSEEPASYAGGSGPFSLADFREEMRERSQGIRRPVNADELWRDELMGKRRHLTGLFRGAYPGSILSESHVRAANLTSQGIGRLSELDDSFWLWELSESEIPQAEAMLAQRKLLVSQAAQP
jgi:hypothetical protein